MTPADHALAYAEAMLDEADQRTHSRPPTLDNLERANALLNDASLVLTRTGMRPDTPTNRVADLRARTNTLGATWLATLRHPATQQHILTPLRPDHGNDQLLLWHTVAAPTGRTGVILATMLAAPGWKPAEPSGSLLLLPAWTRQLLTDHNHISPQPGDRDTVAAVPDRAVAEIAATLFTPYGTGPYTSLTSAVTAATTVNTDQPASR